MMYTWRDGDAEHRMAMVTVSGTNGNPFSFGAISNGIPVDVRDFAIMTTPVTQALWQHVMGENPSARIEAEAPVENVPWYDIVAPNGFLARINAGHIREQLSNGNPALRFRLPTETEWEYAARGGPHWKDGFLFSGSNDPDDVAWYGRKFSPLRRTICNVLGWKLGWRLTGRGNKHRPTRTHAVATKKPNQLGIYDMCGNVWEWCEDICTDNMSAVPRDGAPYKGLGVDRRLRGGCHHNWDLHCTVFWRYGIAPDAHDGCVGFRLVLA